MGRLISESLLVERLSNGKRKLRRELVVESRGNTIVVPSGFETDFSSIPFKLVVVGLTLFALWKQQTVLIFLLLLLLPKYSKVDIAGVVHDYLYKKNLFGKWKSDMIWLDLALSGEHRAASWQAYPNWLYGLVIGAWPAWIKHRWRESRTNQ